MFVNDKLKPLRPFSTFLTKEEFPKTLDQELKKHEIEPTTTMTDEEVDDMLRKVGINS
jgi:hypothetical protein